MKKIYQSPRIDVVQLGGKGKVCDDSVIVFYSRRSRSCRSQANGLRHGGR